LCYDFCLDNSVCVACAVDGGHRAVIFDRFRGVQETIVGEGTHFLIPWVQRPIIFDIRSSPRSVPTVTGSKGLLYSYFLSGFVYACSAFVHILFALWLLVAVHKSENYLLQTFRNSIDILLNCGQKGLTVKFF